MSLVTGWKRRLRGTRVYRAAGPAVLYLRNKWFDVKYRVHTAETVPMSKLKLSGPHVAEGVIYATLNESALSSIFARIPVQFSDYSFVDFGSGKGKAVLVASRWPFRKVVGVEFSDELIAVARRNLESYRGPALRCTQVELVRLDATEFTIPDGPLVLYFYNPFREVVMRTVVENILRSLRQVARPILIIYMNPECRRLFEDSAEFHEIENGDWHVVYAAGLDAYKAMRY
jgi:hypothetical protein